MEGPRTRVVKQQNLASVVRMGFPEDVIVTVFGARRVDESQGAAARAGSGANARAAAVAVA